MLHNADPARKVHSAKTTKSCSLRNAQLEATAMFRVQNNLITSIQVSASFANNVYLEANALPREQFIPRDVLQEPIALMALTSVSLVLKVSIAARLIQQLSHR